MSDPNFVKYLCDGLPEKIQMKIKAAYWHGVTEGLNFTEEMAKTTHHQVGNVVFLDKKTKTLRTDS